MKTLKTAVATALILSAIFLTSCKQSQTLPLSLTGHSDLKFSGIGYRKIKGEVKVHIKNPNPVDIKVYPSNLDIKVNDICIGKAEINKRLVIPANSEVEQVLYLKSDFSGIGYTDIPKVIQTVQSKRINLQVKGNLRSGRMVHKTKVAVDMTETINMEEKSKPVLALISKSIKRGTQLLKKIKN